MKIAVAGTGYVRLSIAILLAQHHHAMAVDIVPEKEEKINNRHLSIYRKVPRLRLHEASDIMALSQ